jgi:hypothetical protein
MPASRWGIVAKMRARLSAWLVASPHRPTRLAGAAAGFVAALFAAAIGAALEWHPVIGGLGLKVDEAFGLVGLGPATLAGALIAPNVQISGTRRLLLTSAKMSALAVFLGILEVLLAFVVGLVVVGPASFGTSDVSLAGFVVVIGAVYAFGILGPLVAIGLFPLAIAWALAVRWVLRVQVVDRGPHA